MASQIQELLAKVGAGYTQADIALGGILPGGVPASYKKIDTALGGILPGGVAVTKSTPTPPPTFPKPVPPPGGTLVQPPKTPAEVMARLEAERASQIAKAEAEWNSYYNKLSAQEKPYADLARVQQMERIADIERYTQQNQQQLYRGLVGDYGGQPWQSMDTYIKDPNVRLTDQKAVETLRGKFISSFGKEEGEKAFQEFKTNYQELGEANLQEWSQLSPVNLPEAKKIVTKGYFKNIAIETGKDIKSQLLRAPTWLLPEKRIGYYPERTGPQEIIAAPVGAIIGGIATPLATILSTSMGSQADSPATKETIYGVYGEGIKTATPLPRWKPAAKLFFESAPISKEREKYSKEYESLIKDYEKLSKDFEEGKITQTDFIQSAKKIQSKPAWVQMQQQERIGVTTAQKEVIDSKRTTEQKFAFRTVKGSGDILKFVTPGLNVVYASSLIGTGLSQTQRGKNLGETFGGALNVGFGLLGMKYALGKPTFLKTPIATSAATDYVRYAKFKSLIKPVVFGGVLSSANFIQTYRATNDLPTAFGSLVAPGVLFVGMPTAEYLKSYEKFKVIEASPKVPTNLIKKGGVDIGSPLGIKKGMGIVQAGDYQTARAYASSGQSYVWIKTWKLDFLNSPKPTYAGSPYGRTLSLSGWKNVGYQQYKTDFTQTAKQALAGKKAVTGWLQSSLYGKGLTVSQAAKEVRYIRPKLIEASQTGITRVFTGNKPTVIEFLGKQQNVPITTKSYGQGKIVRKGLEDISIKTKSPTGGKKTEYDIREVVTEVKLPQQGKIKIFRPEETNPLLPKAFTGVKYVTPVAGKVTQRFKTEYLLEPQAITKISRDVQGNVRGTFVTSIGGKLKTVKFGPEQELKFEDVNSLFVNKQLIKQTAVTTPLKYNKLTGEFVPRKTAYLERGYNIIETKSPPKLIVKEIFPSSSGITQIRQGRLVKEATPTGIKVFKVIKGKEAEATPLGTSDVFLESYKKIYSGKGTIAGRPEEIIFGKTPIQKIGIYQTKTGTIKYTKNIPKIVSTEYKPYKKPVPISEMLASSTAQKLKTVVQGQALAVPSILKSDTSSLVTTITSSSISPIIVGKVDLSPSLSPKESPTPVTSPTPVLTPTLTPILTPTLTPTLTPVVTPTPVVQPVVTPVVQPIVTPVVTPVVQPIVTPVVTPVVQPIVTPFINPTPTLPRPQPPFIKLKKKTKVKVKPKKQVREKGYYVITKIKKKDILITPKPLIKGQALSFGVKYTKGTERATFKIVPAKEKPVKINIKPMIEQEVYKLGYRPPVRKGKVLPIATTFIQKKPTRLGTRAEVKAVQSYKRSKLW